MPYIGSIKKFLYSHIKLLKCLLLLFSLPIILYIVNLILNTIFNLGVYSGTFLRLLYNFFLY